MSILGCKDLHVRIAGIRVVEGLNLEVRPGEFWGLLGPNGIGKTTLLKCLAGLAERPHIAATLGPDAEPEGPHRAWPIPARVTDVVLAEGRVLFVGDAAAATDPMTGEGIGQAVYSGRLAGRAVSQTDLALYPAWVGRTLWPESKAGMRNPIPAASC